MQRACLTAVVCNCECGKIYKKKERKKTWSILVNKFENATVQMNEPSVSVNVKVNSHGLTPSICPVLHIQGGSAATVRMPFLISACISDLVALQLLEWL